QPLRRDPGAGHVLAVVVIGDGRRLQPAHAVEMADGHAEAGVVPHGTQVGHRLVVDRGLRVAGLFEPLAQAGLLQRLARRGQSARHLPDDLAHTVAIFALQQDLAGRVEADDADADARRLQPGVFIAPAVGQFDLVDDDADPTVAKDALR